VSIPNFQQRERILHALESGDEVLSMKVICDLLRVHPHTLYKMIKKGKMPSFRIGTDWRFYKGQIVRWMAENRLSPWTDPAPRSEPPTLITRLAL
jgi:excisionase family DNA binding protein